MGLTQQGRNKRYISRFLSGTGQIAYGHLAMLLRSTRLTLTAAVLLAGCSADPPGFYPMGPDAPKTSVYAATARCVAGTGCDPSRCSVAAGAPDNRTVDLARCQQLDLTFAGGEVTNRKDAPDLVIHTGKIAGLTRIEASDEGREFSTVGFIGGTPAGVPKECLTSVSGTLVYVDLDTCNTVVNANVVRLIRDTTVNGGPTIDAVKALRFSSEFK